MSNTSKEQFGVLILGQTPPPFGGQAIMIASLVNAEFDGLKIFHIRLNFSRRLSETERFKPRKLLNFISICLRAIFLRITRRIDIVYYPPSAGKSFFPFYRDVLLLLFLRLLFRNRKFVLVFHAAGLSEHLIEIPHRLEGLRGYAVKKAFFHVDAAVQVSMSNPPDGDFVRAKRTFIIPNGIEDELGRFKVEKRENVTIPQILYVGVLTEEKGIGTLLEAASLLRQKGIKFKVVCVGEFGSRSYEKSVRSFLRENDLDPCFTLTGVLVGKQKWETFIGSDIFCYPTFAPFESFGLVLAEAMMFELPVVATKWRGLQGIVEDGETGVLITARDRDALAKNLELMVQNSWLRRQMGLKGRERYLREFTLVKMLERYREMFVELHQM